ncbi:30S ribosomal protein S11 [Patescibacteria group bacterium]|nr:30S ribosomal protein S11 [Patescibacteria group bacterium]
MKEKKTQEKAVRGSDLDSEVAQTRGEDSSSQGLSSGPKTDSQREEKKEEKPKKKRKKKGKVRRKISRGKVFIKSTYNNTIVTITDLNGNTLAWGSAGLSNFRGPKKATPYAATIITRTVLDKVKDTGLSEVDVFVKGIGGGREAAVRALSSGGLAINVIQDVTPVPHNGCRSKKVRRV